MPQVISDILGRFGPLTRATQTAGTVITVPVPPWRGPLGSPAFRYEFKNGRANWFGRSGRTVVTSVLYTTSTTAHTITVMRPFNWTYITEAVTANDTTVVIAADPGVYSTNYRYASPLSTGTAAVADNAIAAADYVMFQLLDGTWHVSTVASVSSLTLTLDTATPNITGGGAAVNTPLFFFGAAANSDPATGLANPSTLTIASTNRINQADDDILGMITSVHAGDPLILHSSNATAAGSFEGVAGMYSKF